jgi:two-component system sensor histidine kinase RegB
VQGLLAGAAAISALPRDALTPCGVAAFLAVSNAALVAWARGDRPVREIQLAAVLLLDVVVLTAGLALVHGTFNPFTALYVVYVAIGAMVLSPVGASAITAACIAGYALLFLVDGSGPGSEHAHPDMASGMGTGMGTHLAGMWVAFVVAGPFVVYAIARVRRALARYEDELAAERVRSARNDKLAALATLSAGAAHELGTPLGTIAIAARELEQGAGDPHEDGRLILEEVARCDEIVHRLAVRAANGLGEAPCTSTARQLLQQSCRGLDPEHDVRLELGTVGDRVVCVPVGPLASALRGLVDNGLDASADDEPVVITADEEEGGLVIRIRDRGTGIAPDARDRLGEPFFTTKGAEGMGLGVYFARSVLDHIGGTMDFESHDDGTTAVVRLPPREDR